MAEHDANHQRQPTGKDQYEEKQKAVQIVNKVNTAGGSEDQSQKAVLPQQQSVTKPNYDISFIYGNQRQGQQN